GHDGDHRERRRADGPRPRRRRRRLPHQALQQGGAGRRGPAPRSDALVTIPTMLRDKIRVLVVDDSVVVRGVVAMILEEDPAIEVAGVAADGASALAKAAQARPDLVILDLEMPGMSGLEALPLLRKIDPRMQVIIFSSLTSRGAAATLDALALGAADYVTKPAGASGLAGSKERIRSELLPKIKATFKR